MRTTFWHPPHGRTSGFTLIELLISVGVLGIVLAALGMVQSRSADESRVLQARGIAEARARRALDRAASQLTGVGQTLILPDPTTTLGASALTFQRPTGVSNTGLVQWETPSRLELQLDPRELDDGVDNDADGLVDERRLVLTRNFGTANAQSVVLCTGIPELAPGETVNLLDDNANGVVDEAGFNVRRVGDLLTVRVTVQQPFAGDQVATVTLSTSIVLHN